MHVTMHTGECTGYMGSVIVHRCVVTSHPFFPDLVSTLPLLELRVPLNKHTVCAVTSCSLHSVGVPPFAHGDAVIPSTGFHHSNIPGTESKH